jgi:hypothetical protein
MLQYPLLATEHTDAILQQKVDGLHDDPEDLGLFLD